MLLPLPGFSGLKAQCSAEKTLVETNKMQSWRRR